MFQQSVIFVFSISIMTGYNAGASYKVNQGHFNLQLRNGLLHFKDCTVHLIVTQIIETNKNWTNVQFDKMYYVGDDKNETRTIISTYQVEPLDFPVILQYVQYTFWPDPSRRFSNRHLHYKKAKLSAENLLLFYCDDVPLSAGWRSTNLFHFVAGPPPKLSCVAQVWIDPPICRTIRQDLAHWAIFELPRIHDVNSFYAQIPWGISNPVTANRFEPRGRANMYMIHVRQYNPEYNWLIMSNYRYSIFTLAEKNWKPLHRPKHIYSPTKLVFEINPIINNYGTTYEIVKAKVLSCMKYHLLEQDLGRKHFKEYSRAILDWSKEFDNSKAGPDAIEYNWVAKDKPLDKSVSFLDKLQMTGCHEVYWIYGVTKGECPNTKQSYNIRDYIKLTNRDNTNINLILMSTLQNNSSYVCVKDGVDYKFHKETISPLFEDSEGPLMKEEYAIYGKHKQIYYVTCSTAGEAAWLSAKGYVSAYNVNSWVAIAVSAVVCICSGAVIKTMVFWVEGERAGSLKNGFKLFRDLIWFPYDVLLCQGAELGKMSRWISGTFIVAGVVLSNMYLGENIDSLTAPLGERELESVEELIENNYTLHPYNKAIDHFKWILKMWGRKQIEAMAQDPVTAMKNINEIYLFENNFAVVFKAKHHNLTLLQILDKYRSFVAKAVYHKDLGYISILDYTFEQIRTCQKNAFVDTFDNVYKVKVKMEVYFNNNGDAKYNQRNKVTVGKHPYGQLMEMWEFANVPWPLSIFRRKVLSLFHSGIVKAWKGWEERLDTWNDTVASERLAGDGYKAIDISDNIVVVFYVHLALLLIPSFAFALEIWPIYLGLVKSKFLPTARRIMCCCTPFSRIKKIINIIKFSRLNFFSR